MGLIELSNNSDYRLVHEDQDVRGWPVNDRTGNPLGVVDDMIIDTDREMVDSIRLDSGETIPAADITLGEGVVHYAGRVAEPDRGPVVRTYEFGKVRRDVNRIE